MCGISGFVDFNKNSTKEILIEMNNALHHRGPDSGGCEFIENEYAQIGIGHRRLSIIDLSIEAHQPMWSLDKNYLISFNGEIYNFKEIRKELEEKKHSFKSNSDTEVVLTAFIEWGVESVQKFIGMFAFTIFDIRNKKILLFRDRAGVKPLFYYINNGILLFASELKSFHEHIAFRKNINLAALAQFLNYGYILTPNCIFENAFKLEPGHFIELDLMSRKLRKTKYWDIFDCYNKPKLKIDKVEAKELLHDKLKSAFKYRMVADVPVGVFLSGGYDSTVVTAILQSQQSSKIDTFTIGVYDKNLNEAQYAKEIAEIIGSTHHERYCTEEDAKKIIPELSFFFDEPFFDYSAIPTILVSRLAKEKVKVSLSADGADELFGGYSKFLKFTRKVESEKNLLTKSLIGIIGDSNSKVHKTLSKHSSFYFNNIRKLNTMKVLNENRDNTDFQLSTFNSGQFQELEINYLLNNQNENFNYKTNSYNLSNDLTELDKALAIDYKTYLLDDILVKVDRATMSTSLEGREPFLDHRIAEFVATLPTELKINNGVQKYLLKEIVHDYIPKNQMDRPKMGFAIPLAKWLSNDLNYLIDQYLNDERIIKQNIFDYRIINHYKKAFNLGQRQFYSRLWILIVFQMWYEKWIDKTN